jgi:steroid delta-isomerase-like uncharacterized protein
MKPQETIQAAVAAFNRHDPSGFAGKYAPDTKVRDPFYPEPLQGRAAIEKDISEFMRAFPSARFDLKRTIADGDVVAGQYVISGMHEGPLVTPGGEFPPTGRQLQLEGSAFSRLNERGEIVEEQRYFDIAGVLQQLGLAG